MIVHGASLLTSWPQTDIWRETLSQLEFLVSIDRQLTADAAYADIVLPATTMFEIDSYMVYGPIFRLREKIIDPVGESRNDYLIMAGLARSTRLWRPLSSDRRGHDPTSSHRVRLLARGRALPPEDG